MSKAPRNAFDQDAIISLIVNSGIYRHHTLREQLQKSYSTAGGATGWDGLTTTHWEVLYCLIACHLLDRDVAITDIPLDTGLSASTSRRALRRLEDLKLVTTTCDEQDKRRFSTELSPEYHHIIDEFVEEYADEFATLIQRHDKQERIVALEALERTREELIASEALLIQAQRLGSMGHWVWDDVNSVYLMVSEEVARIYGMSVRGFLTRANVEYFDDRYVHPDDKVWYQAVILEADQSLMGYDTQVRIIRKNGEVRHIREISEPVLDEDGTLMRSIGTTQDITDSVATEIALRESEARLVQAQRLASLGHWVWDDINDNYVTVSEENARIHGLSVHEFLNSGEIACIDDRFVHPDDKERHRAIVREADQKLRPYDSRHRIIRADGVVRHVREISEPVLDQTGTLVRSVGITQDITESVETEIALRESEAYLINAQQLSSLGHWVWGFTKNKFISVSEQAARIYGLPAEDYLIRRGAGYSDDVFMHPDDREQVRATIREADQNCTGWDVQFRIIRADGELRHIREVSEPALDKDGNLIRSIGTTQDITENIEVEKAFKESEAQLIQAQKLSSLGHWIWNDIDKMYISVSEETARIFGISVAECIGSRKMGHLGDSFVHPEDKAEMNSVIRKADQDGVGYDIRHRIIRADGKLHHVREISEPVLDKDGKMVRSIGTTQDITESVEAEVAARKSDQRFQRLLDEQSDLISMFLPDGTRTYVNQALSTFLGKSRDHLLTGKYGDDVEMHQKVPTLNQIVHNLTPMSKNKRQTFELRRHDGELRTVQWSDSGIFDDDGNLVEILTIGCDITDQL